MPVLAFLSSTAGRWTRGLAGVALISAGALIGSGAWALAGLGVVFVAVAVADLCLVAPLVGKPLRGADFRASLPR